MDRPVPTDGIDPLAPFLSPTRAWFERTFGQPTSPQAQGWPAIQRGDHTLILAPTGSGKTLAAFLWGIDQIYHRLAEAEDTEPEQAGDEQPPRRRRQNRKSPPATIDLVYISPLKALNNDVERNLRIPLAGIRREAERLEQELPELRVAVRSGDTPSRERQAMLRRPPHILITTPESLYILLTSPKAREMFRDVRTVIVDEIHTLAGAKRGVHLSLTLERLQRLASAPIQRIGLSATIQPLDEVARFLGGSEWRQTDAGPSLVLRPVTLVNAGYRKPLDLRVETVVEDFHSLAAGSVWPSIVPKVHDLIQEHASTLIFVNSRRLAERAADWLNAYQAGAEAGSTEGPLTASGVAQGVGMMGLGRSDAQAEPIRAHHGSISKESRLALERDLKAGKLPAIIGTSSLELGIDIGAIDLVIQLQAPKSVAQGLQRVGRSGHLVGQTSKGRIFPTHHEDIMEAAAVAGGMLRGDVEPTHTPRNPLDVLAQQIVAMVSVEDWSADELFDRVRCAYAYRDLTSRAYHAVLDMLAGRYPSGVHRELRARIGWDKVNGRLAALPGSRLLAITNGGAIPDRGAFGAYLSDGKTKLGELDEEFVYETRVGDTFTLGSQVWRVTEVTDDRVMVTGAAGATPRMPFWRGDFPWRPYALGRRVGAFRRAVAERLDALAESLALASYGEIRSHAEDPAVEEFVAWLRNEYALDPNSAWHVVDYVAGQLDHAGAISSDKSVLIEVFDDPLGDPRLVVHSPFGGRVNGLWGIALAAALRERTGAEVEVQSNDDGILFRFPASEAAFPLDAVTGMTPAEARERILLELPNSAVFGAQFRQNAARSLLLPQLRGGKRTPFWLQRLRAKDLLRLVRQFEDFPIVAETYRDCLQEVMDLPSLERVLAAIVQGDIQVTVVDALAPSPVAQSLMWDFISVYMYEWDAPKAERQLQTLAVNRDLLQDLLKDVNLADLLRPEAVDEIRDRLQHTAPMSHVRSAEELAQLFLSLGDLSSVEVAERCTVDPSGWLGQLAGNRRIEQQAIPTAAGVDTRWVAGEYAADYRAAFARGPAAAAGQEPEWTPDELRDSARRRILARFLAQSGPVTTQAILSRYRFPKAWLSQELELLVAGRQLAHGRFSPGNGSGEASPGEPASEEYVDRRTLEQIHRRTLTILRSEVRPAPFSAYAAFLARRQHLHPQERLAGPGALRQVLQQLRAFPVVGRVWERDVLPLRLSRYSPDELAGLCQSGELVWVGSGGIDPRRSRMRFLFRGEGRHYLEPPPGDLSELSDEARQVYDYLRSEGALFQTDLLTGLGIAEREAGGALLELVMAGLVTNDSMAAFHRIVQGELGPPAESRALSALERDLAQRLGHRHDAARPGAPGRRRPSRTQMRDARRRVQERLEQSPVSPAQVGRWTLVHRAGVLGKEASVEERALQQSRQLLSRYGVVTHECLDGEYGAWDWSTIYPTLQRLEMRGEVRRGYFVQGLSGVQFAMPDVVEELRAAAAGDGDDSLVVLSSCDPASLYGPARPDGPLSATGDPLAFQRIPSTWFVQHRGLPVLLVENSGASLSTVQGAGDNLVRRALQSWLAHLATFESRTSTEQWNGVPILDSPGASLLESCGYYRNYPAMTWSHLGP